MSGKIKISDADRILFTLAAQPNHEVGSFKELARLAGLSEPKVHAALRSLRRNGKVGFDDFRLSRSMIAKYAGTVTAEPLVAVVEDVRDPLAVALQAWMDRAGWTFEAVWRAIDRIGSRNGPGCTRIKCFLDGSQAIDGPRHRALIERLMHDYPHPGPYSDWEYARVTERQNAAEQELLAQRNAVIQREEERAAAQREAAEKDAAVRACARAKARKTTATRHPIPIDAIRDLDPTAVELIQTLGCECPGDAARVMQARWVDVWRSLVIAARADGVNPVVMMVRSIEAGLDCFQESEAA